MLRKSVRMADILRGPLTSLVAMPKDAMAMAASFCSAVMSFKDIPRDSIALAAIFGGPASRRKPERKAVPACDALMPLFAIRPARAAVSSIDAPNAWATGAAYFIVSPSISTLVLVLVITAAYTSAICADFSALSPKAVRLSDTMSAVLAKSVPPAAARLSKPGIPARI